MSKELTIRFTDEMWEAFKEACEQRHGIKSPEPETEARDIIHEAMKAYVHGNGEPRTHQTAKDIIDEAMEIADSEPRLLVYEQRVPDYSSAPCWRIKVPDNGYSVTARGAEQLLREVKEARAFYEALQELEKKEQADAKRDESHVIRIESLDQSTREILLHFIEHLTIGKAVDIVADGNYPNLALDELYAISVQLKLSLVEGDDWR
jgi:muramidase (phage lysozyme)